MEALKTLINNALALDSTSIMVTVLSDNPIVEKLAIQLVQRRQLKFGITGDDHFLGEYSAASVLFYGKEEGPIQLKDTGEFYESMEMVLTDDGFFINADGQKDDTNLFIEYGSDITKLNDKNFSIFIDRLVLYIQEAIIKMLFKNV